MNVENYRCHTLKNDFGYKSKYMAKRIILSADDFGRNPYRNQAIDEAFSKGFIKSAALIVNSSDSIEAINLAIRGGYIQHIHCHFN